MRCTCTLASVTVLASATAILWIYSPTYAGESDLLLSVSYDAKLNTGTQANHTRSRAVVRFKAPIVIQYQTFRIELTFLENTTDQYRAQIDVFERSASDWVPINPEPISFVGNYSAPVEFDWTHIDIDVSISLVIFVGFR